MGHENISKIGESDIKRHLKRELLRTDRVDEKLKEEQIEIQKACVLRYRDDKPWRWEVGFDILRKDCAEYYRAILSYPDLIIIGIVREEKEFTGRDALDLKYIIRNSFHDECEYPTDMEEEGEVEK